uniref:Uncharacterized protein n=1 Tax=Physcomitrium patens TaxID=3218 RepID=A0A2K1J945_PHYPA|nr:hypothetical protein PHYPA_021159 [Physcomitrium patens]
MQTWNKTIWHLKDYGRSAQHPRQLVRSRKVMSASRSA